MLAALVCVQGPSAPAGADDPEPVRILLVGDSITQGSSGDWTWRYRLWRHLADHGVAVDLVGPRTDLKDYVSGDLGSQDYLDPGFDRDHAARWGMQLADLDVPVETLVATYQPDVVVTLLGDNDLGAGRTPQEVADLLEAYVGDARSADPAVDLVLARDPRPLIQPGVPAYNALVTDLAAELDSPASPVVVADTDLGYDDYADTFDFAHPNARGELKIAAAVADALSELGVGPPADRPLPDVPVGPRTPPVLTPTARPGGVDLTWVRSPGAQQSEVWVRDLSAGSGWSRAADAVTGLGHSLSGLPVGHTVQVQTRPVKGFIVAQPDAWSNVVQVEVPDVTDRVLLFGDSILQGSAGDWTVRYRLWKHLAATSSRPVDLVGPRGDLFDRKTATAGNDDYVDPAFDTDHASVWGMNLAVGGGTVGDLVTTYRPRVVVVGLGINDLLVGSTPEQVGAGAANLVAAARARDPGVDVVLSELSQTWAPGVVEANERLRAVAASLDGPGARVVVAAVTSDYRRGRDTYDGSHPGAPGEVRIAAALADALAQLGVGSPAARPLPDVPVGPRVPVRLKGKDLGDRVRLKWTPSPGATGYRVLVRRPGDGRGWRVLLKDTDRRRFVVRGLRAGERVVLAVLPRKGRDLAEMDVLSNRVSLRPGP